MLDTTDVQKVQVSQKIVTGDNTNEIVCDFMLGTKAQGCMVVLMGKFDNTTVNLTRKGESREAVSLHKLRYPLSCYDEAFAWDIESDGSVGALSVPVTLLINNVSSQNTCLPYKEASSQS